MLPEMSLQLQAMFPVLWQMFVAQHLHDHLLFTCVLDIRKKTGRVQYGPTSLKTWCSVLIQLVWVLHKIRCLLKPASTSRAFGGCDGAHHHHLNMARQVHGGMMNCVWRNLGASQTLQPIHPHSL